MARGDLTEHEWQQLQPLLPPQQTGRRGNQYHDHRTTLNGILWVLRTGAPWRDLPERYGPWQTCYARFRRWSRSGIFDRALAKLQAQADQQGQIDWAVTALDGSFIKAHPHAAGAPKRGLPPRKANSSRHSDAVGVD
jgi:transposase